SATPADNKVLVGPPNVPGTEVANFSPAPPRVFPSGTHEGAFLPRFSAGEQVTWQVNGKTVSASATDTNIPILASVPIGTSGRGVYIQGRLVIVQPDLANYETPPSEPAVADGPPV